MKKIQVHYEYQGWRLCPKCGQKGNHWLKREEYLSTGYMVGPYLIVRHQKLRYSPTKYLKNNDLPYNKRRGARSSVVATHSEHWIGKV